MTQVHWSKKRIIYVCIGAMILYFLLRKRTQNITFEVTIDNSKPIDVWEYFADFSNMKILNPELGDFSIISESGNYDHWKYSAQYNEQLSHFPYTHSNANAHFNVKPDGKDFVIHSTHNTCFFGNHACLDSVSVVRFSASDAGTKCFETVTYECPAVLSSLCHRSVKHQRQVVMDNLQNEFSNNGLP